MKKLCIVIFFLSINSITVKAQVKDRVIYGVCTKDSLLLDPFQNWFRSNYEAYIPDAATLKAIKAEPVKGITIKIFFGSWCGDSRRELPRFYKLLDGISFAESKLQLIGVGGSDSLIKQSPGGEEKGLGIFRVPVMIVYNHGKELGRINEYPAVSLEKDFLSILKQENYIPNYASFAILHKWLEEGSLADDNTSNEGMANQIRSLISNEGELNSVSNLLFKQNLQKEGLKILKINYALFPNSANVLRNLGEAFLNQNEKTKAVRLLELAVKENKDPAQFTNLLDLLYKAKEK